MRGLLLPLFFVISGELKSQTCILIHIRNDTITIGADSKVNTSGVLRWADGRTKDTVIYQTSCKIRKRKNVIYTGAGWMMEIAMKFAKLGIDKQVIFKDSLDYPFRVAEKALTDSMEKIRIKDFKGYKQNLAGHRSDVLFFWFYNGKAKGYAISYNTINKDNEKVRLQIFRRSLPMPPINSNIYAFNAFGYHDAVDKEIAQGGLSFWISNGTVNGIIKLLDLQIHSTPMDVGYPISILQMTKNNTRWFDSGACKIKFTN